jgi:hypothetical protein
VAVSRCYAFERERQRSCLTTRHPRVVDDGLDPAALGFGANLQTGLVARGVSLIGRDPGRGVEGSVVLFLRNACIFIVQQTAHGLRSCVLRAGLSLAGLRRRFG